MKKIIYAMLALLIIGSTACNDDDDNKIHPKEIEATDTTLSSLTITVDHKMGTADMVYNEDVILPSKEQVQISRLSYILGNFYLLDDEDNKTVLDDQYALIEDHRGNTTFSLTNVPQGNYKAIGFSIGLDSATNHGNPNQYDASHPLAPINNSLHWNWTGGYIFTALEGKTMMNDESFVFHLAGAQNRIDVELSAQVAITAEPKTATLTYDVNEIFQNPEIYNIGQDGSSSHSTTSPVTVKLIRNMSDVFTSFEVK